MNGLLTLHYWFQIQPPAFAAKPSYILLGFFIALIIAAIAVKVYRVKKHDMEKLWRRAYDKIFSSLLTMGIVGLFMFLFSYEQIPILSMRFLYLIWSAGFILWAYLIYLYITKEIPAKKAMQQQRDEQNKWLPNVKK